MIGKKGIVLEDMFWWHANPSGVTSSHGLAWRPEIWPPTLPLVFPHVQNFQTLWVSLYTYNCSFESILFVVVEHIWSSDTLLRANSLYCQWWGKIFTFQDWMLNLPNQKLHRMGVIVQILLIWRPGVKKLAAILSAPGFDLATNLPFYISCGIDASFLQGWWRLYNIYSSKQWQRTNCWDWIKVLWPGKVATLSFKEISHFCKVQKMWDGAVVTNGRCYTEYGVSVLKCPQEYCIGSAIFSNFTDPDSTYWIYCLL